MNQGKFVIVFIFGLSAVMGGYAWWHHFTQGRKCLALWGAEAAELIRHGDGVELIGVESDAPSDDSIEIDGTVYSVGAREDIAGTQGLVHARQALIEDGSFLWGETSETPPVWHYVLRFSQDGKQVSIAIDCDQGNVKLVGSDRQAVLNEHLTEGYRSRLPMWLENATKTASPIQPESAGTP